MPAAASAGTSRSECRARAAHLESQQQAQRDLALGELSSQALGPEQRICLWEKLYEVRLPREANHPALSVISAITGLSLEQIREEQRRRYP